MYVSLCLLTHAIIVHLFLYTHILSGNQYGILAYHMQGSPQEIKVEWYGMLIFINTDHESH